jgi:hypothetical protein
VTPQIGVCGLVGGRSDSLRPHSPHPVAQDRE